MTEEEALFQAAAAAQPQARKLSRLRKAGGTPKAGEGGLMPSPFEQRNGEPDRLPTPAGSPSRSLEQQEQLAEEEDQERPPAGSESKQASEGEAAAVSGP